jgi:hypothetical protein
MSIVGLILKLRVSRFSLWGNLGQKKFLEMTIEIKILFETSTIGVK